MRLAKPILLTATPLGVLGGLHEAWKLSPGLAFLMAAMLAVMTAAIGSVVLTVRRENAEEARRQQLTAGPGEAGPEP